MSVSNTINSKNASLSGGSRQMVQEFNLKEYLQAQLEEIHRHKWIESEKKGFDIGFDKAFHDWVAKYAADFKKFWFSDKEEK